MTKVECEVRKWYSYSEETLLNESYRGDGTPLRKHVVAAIVRNPYAGKYEQELSPFVQASETLGAEFGQRLVSALGAEAASSYGKACLVGMAGEHEHGNALLTEVFANPIRTSLGGGKSWVPSTGKRGGPGVSLDIPLAHKDALYVRSHYDTFTVSFPDGPAADEIVVAVCVATRGRLNARLGGLPAGSIKGVDGLR